MASLNFKWKSAVWNHHLSVPYHTLEKVDSNTLDGENASENLFIEWDNLLALKALLPKYQGQVKCIYIDPPYNTGNEGWVYSDNVSNPIIKEWLNKAVWKQWEDMTRHDKWLCMITPRLKLLRELLRSDGVIFVSIDENEVHHLKSLMNEIFREDNFIAMLPTVMNLKGNQDEFGFAGTHEYTLVYARDKNSGMKLWEFEIDEEWLEKWEEDDIWPWKKWATLKRTGNDAPREKRPNWWYPIYVSTNNTVSVVRKDANDLELYPLSDGKEMSWRWSSSKVKKEAHNIIVVRDKDSVSLYKKQRPDLWELPSKKPKTLFYKPEYSSWNGTGELKKLFWKKIFENPKPVDLIKDFLTISTDKDSIILDSFAWSGTTAQAVMELNQEDGGSRKFILVQLPETLTEKAQAKLAGYNYVHEITLDRIKKVKKRDNLNVGMTYYKLGESLEWRQILKWESLPSWVSFAMYAHFLVTGKPLDGILTPDVTWEICTENRKTGIYLIYTNTIEELKNLAITRDWLESVKTNKGKKIVYAPACFLDKEILDEYDISFVQIPYNLFLRN